MNTISACVSIVDDDPGIHRALRRLLESVGYKVRSFMSAEEFLNGPPADEPGCLVVDVTMPGMHGLALQQELTRTERGCPVIFLTGNGDVHSCAHAMKMGAVDFLTKPCGATELLDAIARAINIDVAAREDVARRSESKGRLATLTVRERQVMKLVISGHMNKQISFDLGCSEKTVKVHRGRVMQKMRARSVAELVRFASRAGLSDPHDVLGSNSDDPARDLTRAVSQSNRLVAAVRHNQQRDSQDLAACAHQVN